MSAPIILSLLVALLFLVVVVVYNSLVRLRNRADGAWSDIDVQLRRRHDLVGNLVEAVKGYVAHERSTLEGVVEARARAERADAAGPGPAGPAESELTASLRPIFALAEAYPDLKASAGYQNLHVSLVKLEDDIQNARRYYNAVVRDFNTEIQSVPQVFIAGPLGFKARDFFNLSDPAEATVPEIDLQ